MLTAAAGPQGTQVRAVFEKASAIGLHESLALRKATDLHQKFVTDNAPEQVDYGELGLAAMTLAVNAAAAAGRQDALDQLLGSWRSLSQAIATDLFLQMYRRSRPDSPPPSGAALERAASAAASSFELPVGHALVALAARDLIDDDGFPQDAYDFLTTPWSWAVGAAHPDDDTGQTVEGS
ncbi:hypothetical protein KTU01_08340 [Kocuria turfanensis]|uniref:Uncharacterized protein n=2 Tax=Kocuria turfanensis TaxID=388357 RepID=A0A512IAJ3_9MICC|nr:hypothetical protein KTU01_08340 [Kocuria turfanensis]